MGEVFLKQKCTIIHAKSCTEINCGHQKTTMTLCGQATDLERMCAMHIISLELVSRIDKKSVEANKKEA